jgi:FlaA1/EpsC-like NDP-sugar epimerase
MTARVASRTRRPGERVSAAVVGLPPAASFAFVDALLVAVSYVLVLVVRYDGRVPSGEWDDLARFLPLALVVHLGFHAAFHLYRPMWRYASIQEARRLLLAELVSATVLLFTSLTVGPRLPVSVLVFGAGTTTLLVGASRFRARLFAFDDGRGPQAGTRVLVVGAGSAGAAIVRNMLQDPAAGYRPVGIVDDDRHRWGMDLLGVRVHGGIDDIGTVARELDADEVLLAIASAGSDVVNRVASAADEAQLPLRTVPTVAELVDRRLTLHDVRDLRIDDLLGRPPVLSDLSVAAGALAGRVVLITGAGGSIGSEIARQVAACRPALLVLLDQDETHLHDVTTTLTGPIEPVLGDIRDAAAMLELFADIRPDVVFHAAALKHVPILEDHPREALRTNVLGTRNVVSAARQTGVRRFVLISTDKAVAPSSVMGASKWVAERLVLAEEAPGTAYCAVRFGNVLGSRGSVTPTFVRQIAAGGPVTVTDPRMTRFFISIEEAVHLVLVAGAIAEGNEIFMLDMGEPVRILDLAERMIRLSGRRVGTDIELRVTGMRPGEKLHEELHTPEEGSEATLHPSIVRLRPTAMLPAGLASAMARLEELAEDRNGPELRRVLLRTTQPALSLVAATDATIDLRERAALARTGAS